jgi:membrane protease YdiL (CAAX protease family)
MARASSSRSRLKWVFVGPEGLRHGWRFSLFALGMWSAGQLVEAPVARFFGERVGVNPDELSAPAVTIRELVSLGEVLLLTGLAALLEWRRIDGYGLPVGQAFGRFFWRGMLAGLMVVVFVGGAMLLTGGMRVHGPALHGTEILAYGLLWLGGMILVGVNEEYLFRGYALQSLWRGAGFWWAALITTGLFAGGHLSKPHENPMDIGMIFVLGLALCLSVRRTGSLWWAVGWHTAFDFGQFFLIGTRNGGQTPMGHLWNATFPGPAWITGGELGTEASGFMVPAAIATFVYIGWFLEAKRSGSVQ